MKKTQMNIDKLFDSKRKIRFGFSRLTLIAILAFSSLAITAMPGGNFIRAGKTSQNAVAGKWRAEFNRENTRDELLLSFDRSTGGEQNALNREVSLGELKNLTREQASGARTKVSFELEREAGVFRCEGVFQNGKGEGAWAFAPNQTFILSLRGGGYDDLTENDLLRAALDNLTTAFVEYLKSVGFERLKFRQLLTAANLGVTANFIREIQSAGYRNLPIEEYALAKNRGITPEFISQMHAAGFDNVSIRQLAGFKNLQVTPEFINDLKSEGFRNISPEIAVRLKNHRIDRAYIQRVKARGFPNVTLEQLIKLHNLDIIK